MKIFKQIDDLRCEILSRERQVNPSKPEDGLFRKCPHCHLIWYKVSGCSGETTCGARPTDLKKDTGGWDRSINWVVDFADKGYRMVRGWFSSEEPTTPRSSQHWRFIDGKTVVRQYNTVSTKLDRPLSATNFVKAGEKPVGCGATINWSKMPTLN